jgi:hypothetical protein
LNLEAPIALLGRIIILLMLVSSNTEWLELIVLLNCWVACNIIIKNICSYLISAN